MKKIYLLNDTRGDAVVEATILFPIMLMIFAAMVMLSMYLPQSAVLQRAVQYAAESLALERSDVGYRFNEDSMSVEWDYNLHNSVIGHFTGTNKVTNSPWYRMFGWFFEGSGDWEDRAKIIIDKVVGASVTMTNAPINVTVDVRKTVLYSEIEVKAIQEIPIPIDFSFIGFPKIIKVEKTALYMIPDGDTYIRNVDDVFLYAESAVRAGDVVNDLKIGGIAEHLKTFLKTIVGLD